MKIKIVDDDQVIKLNYDDTNDEVLIGELLERFKSAALALGYMEEGWNNAIFSMAQTIQEG